MEGIIRKLDPLCRLTIPADMRKLHNMAEGDSVEVVDEGTRIVVKKHNPGCMCCSNTNNVTVFHGIRICNRCMNKMRKLME